MSTKNLSRFGLNFEADEHNFISKDLGNARHQGVFSSDAMWSHMSQISSHSVSESRNGSIAISNCFQKQTGEDAKPLDIAAARSEQHVTSGHLSLSSAGCLKQEYQSPPSLFSDWHWKKDFGSSGL
ncbi:hypothetical protein RIF29_33203 [Crotalaria pallida]|uniref:Uncharacterized protein n=1 Tax=Crotalaria pallida TaxID=3830 RepID=A0AAN9EAF6_CROPI